MNCTIPAPNLKIMGKALQTLARIGDELYIEAKSDSLFFRTINANTTVFSSFEFLNSYFTSFNVAEFETESEDTPELVCKIQMKAILAIFKPLHGHKNLDFCQIEFNNEDTFLTFRLRYKFDAVVTHKVYLMDMESWQVSYSKDNTVNQISATGQCFSQVLSNFQLNDDDLSLEVMQHKIIMRNYDMGETNSISSIRSQYVLNAIDFTTFKINNPTHITFSMKPFRSAVQFAEHFNINLTLNFETAGKPAVIVVKSSTFQLDVVMATIGSDGSTQTSVGSLAPPVAKRKANDDVNLNLTREDKEALENVDWDEDMGNDRQNKQKRPKLGSVFERFASESNNVSNGNRNEENQENEPRRGQEDNEVDFVPDSPESPKTKKIRMIFGRCYEPTFCEKDLDLGEVLAPNSDSE